MNLGDILITTPTGSRVPLSEIADYEIHLGEVPINHLDYKYTCNFASN